MFEVLIDKIDYEIVKVKPYPAKWTKFEEKYFIIKQIDDPSLAKFIGEKGEGFFPHREVSKDFKVVKRRRLSSTAMTKKRVAKADFAEFRKIADVKKLRFIKIGGRGNVRGIGR